MGGWNKTSWKSLMLPGGLLLALILALHSGLFTLGLPSITLVHYAALTVGLLLSWRFHSSRIFFALVVILLARQAMAAFPPAHLSLAGPAHFTFVTVGFLLPLNFLLLALMTERGFTVSGMLPTGIFLAAQALVIIVLSRVDQPASSSSARMMHRGVTLFPPDYVIGAFVVAAVVVLARFLWLRKPVESAMFWSLGALFLALRFAGDERISTAYFAASALILSVSIVETSYFLAYHDELTALPSRRAFNEALLRLEMPYSVAVVDIDHFKRFNDTYGHDTGDQVLQLVASRLTHVGGGGQAYRCGGEEFAVLFSGKTTAEVLDHVERLRADIAVSRFRRRGEDRRKMARGPDRRNQLARSPASTGRALRQLVEGGNPDFLSVTVSIGVASSTRGTENADQVIKAADKALYRAKAAGRNRVEAAVSTRRLRAKAAGIA